MSATIVIHDTRSGELQALKEPAEGTLGIYACGPTRVPAHPHRKRPPVRGLQPAAAALPHTRGLRGAPGGQHHRRQRQDLRRRGGRRRAERHARTAHDRAYRADTDALGLGRPDAEPLASETMDAIIDYIRVLVEAGHAYAVDGDVYFRVRSDEEYGSLSHRAHRRHEPGRGGGGRRAQAGPAGLCALEGAQGGRGHRVGVALGGRPARLAHRVLGDGRAAARRRLRDPRRRHRTCSSRTTRTRPPRRGRRGGTSWRGCGCTTGWCR